MMADYDVYCPECDSERVDVREVVDRDRVSIDDLPQKRNSQTSNNRGWVNKQWKEMKAVCLDCGHEKTWRERRNCVPTVPYFYKVPYRERWMSPPYEVTYDNGTGEPLDTNDYKVVCENSD